MTQTLPNDYRPADKLLQDKVIAITGAGEGIGKVAALTFANHGATVILMGRTIAKLEAVYDEIEANGGAQPAIFPINFEGACEKDYEDMAQAIFDAFGKLDGLLHNAALLGERTPVSNYSNDTWQTVMHVNVNAPFMMTKALLPVMEKAESASIIFTGSTVGYEGRAFWGAYAASKAAQENLMQTLAQELEGVTRIRTNSINPGATRTRMRATAYPAENPVDVKAPEALMPLYLYLISSDSEGVSGQQFSYQ
ncbi:MAG: YciK family oxidoreductase [Candidatus Pelagadaptatus aseana]|uniref:YciK family oxidoreductase n=1 Tax=Candidatus Pelagadaptatus aseana TaxID=3120508 RepID=UPI0039B1E664